MKKVEEGRTYRTITPPRNPHHGYDSGVDSGPKIWCYGPFKLWIVVKRKGLQTVQGSKQMIKWGTTSCANIPYTYIEPEVLYIFYEPWNRTMSINLSNYKVCKVLTVHRRIFIYIILISRTIVSFRDTDLTRFPHTVCQHALLYIVYNFIDCVVFSKWPKRDLLKELWDILGEATCRRHRHPPKEKTGSGESLTQRPETTRWPVPSNMEFF